MIKKLFTPFAFTSKEVYAWSSAVWLMIFLLVWYNAPVLIPSPSEMVNRFTEFVIDPDFWFDVLSSLMVTVFGMFISIVTSCIIAFLTTLPAFKPLKTLPVLRFMSMAGFIFMFTLLFHSAYYVKIALLMLGIVPFFILTLTSSIAEIPQEEFDFWTTLGYSPWKQLYYIVVFGRLEVVFKTIKANFAIAWIMIGYIETYSMADGGIGVLLFKANGKTQIDKVLALQLFVLILGALSDYCLGQLRLGLFPHIALTEKK